jgi:hypothetical protein
MEDKSEDSSQSLPSSQYPGFSEDGGAPEFSDDSVKRLGEVHGRKKTLMYSQLCMVFDGNHFAENICSLDELKTESSDVNVIVKPMNNDREYIIMDPALIVFEADSSLIDLELQV